MQTEILSILTPLLNILMERFLEEHLILFLKLISFTVHLKITSNLLQAKIINIQQPDMIFSLIIITFMNFGSKNTL